MRSPIQLLCLLALGCGGEDPAGPRGPLVLRHAFGLIPHGQKPTHDFLLELPRSLGPLVPLNYLGDCTCSSHQLLIRGRDGLERVAPGYRLPQYAVGPEEQLLLRLTIDSSQKEAVDMEPITSRGTVTLQDPGGHRPPVHVAVLFTYGIDSPVRLVPASHMDFGSLPRGRKLTIPMELHSDVDRPIRFGPVHSTDERLAAVLSDDGITLLETTFTANLSDDPGTFHAVVTVETDLEGYRLQIPASGRVIPDITVEPMNKISLGRFDFSEPGAEHFVTVTDHIRSRDPGFAVHSLLDANGTDATQYFAVYVEPKDGDPHVAEVRIEYTGGLKPPQFRGELILAKDLEKGPFISIEVVAFHGN